ncbi:hypothetical protein X798_04477 [Onchocerca flexuosa]|uniref:Uncharacterized protein n=1 Tax=Onchocerca flexuosa TaxID=387005 RepID=A0A238BTB5_9BILA|nr:hypothetical protein X798_04477 [Onchocerca flexuosa]
MAIPDELQTTDDVIQEDELETMSDATATATDPFNQHDYSINLRMESMRLNADYPMKPERTSLGGCNKNTTKVLTEEIISGVENWQQSECYDQNNLCEKESLRKTHSPVQKLLLSDHQTKEMHDVRVELQDDIALGIDESLIQAGKQNKCDFMSHDCDKFNSSFANNSVINNGNDNESSATYNGNNNDNIANNPLTKARNNGPSITLSPDTEIPNDAQYSSLAKQSNDFELISHNNNALATETNDSRDNNDDNSKNILLKNSTSEDLMKKSDDIRKISDKLEAFNKNNEMSNVPKKISRPKIEETEMPTKGVVSNLKSLFENNAVHNNNDTCKSASYKLEYGVGRSSGTLNKGVFH